MPTAQLCHGHARVGLFDKPDDLLGAESALLHVRPLGFTDFIASAGTAQWGQVNLAVLKADVISTSSVVVGGADDATVGTQVASFGFPHADHCRMVLTQQDAEIGARVLIASGGIKAKHLVLNTQARPGQSGSPIFRKTDGRLVGVLVGSYAPGGGGGISLGGVDPHTLHQTTHAVSSEYLSKMY
ncbi:trypsin-like peptidase domain-containing protein [Xanthomonas campestris]|uniref:trypsin-like peptidase domain-containing protein n=1 Tax=Xanthomonas campestris TaxID=339 RepID=UPI0023685411|nr:trypsin-like peptidase domain-containing protein [Xanthomonas campestris]